MQRIEVPVRAVVPRVSGDDATADDISMFCWNVNNRVGRTTFRPEAANAAMETGADVLVFNEFFPGARLELFQRSLRDGGWQHQAMSESAGVKANRVLVASRVTSRVQSLPPSTVDGHLTANALCVDIGVVRVLALRVPTYVGTARQHAWDWIAEVSARLQQSGRPSVIVGDLNTSLAATGARRMEQFHRLLGSGWARTQPEGKGSFSKGDGWLEIDHILATASCRVSSAKYVQRTSSYALAGTAGSLSDHAALMFTAGRNDNVPTRACLNFCV
jgi:endonuclease/exonuclease/phosphatase family metal-dependent hydrolase